MVVPAGVARLAVHVLLMLAVSALIVPMTPWSSSARAAHVSDTNNVSNNNVSVITSGDPAHHQADMPQAQPYYRGQEDIQVGCRELRAKRYISDGFCTSTKPIKEVVCAGTCLPIMDLPWYAEFVKVWASSKLKEWRCEEDVVRRKSVHLLCRNGEYRTYRIKVVKSCKCKRVVPKHNRTVSKDGRRKKKKDKKKRKKDGRRRGKKNRKAGRRNKRVREKVEVEEEEEVEVDISQKDKEEDKIEDSVSSRGESSRGESSRSESSRGESSKAENSRGEAKSRKRGRQRAGGRNRNSGKNQVAAAHSAASVKTNQDLAVSG